MKALWRYARQVQVLGEPAQRALLAGSAVIAAEPGKADDALAPLVEALYLAGAGVGALAVPSRALAEAALAFNPTVAVTVRAAERPDVGPPALPPLRDDAAQSAAEGAARALAAMARLVRER